MKRPHNVSVWRRKQFAAAVVAGPGQGKAGKAGPGQTKPRLGTTGKPAKPKQFFICCNIFFRVR